MSLHNGIDTIGVLSYGVFSKTYGVGEEGNTANIYSSLGYFEDAPGGVVASGRSFADWFWEFIS